MGRRAKHKESKKKKGKIKSEEQDDIGESGPFPTEDENDTLETANYQLGGSVQSIKGKFKTSRQRKRANHEQQLREERSWSLKKTKAQKQQGTVKEKKAQEKKAEKKPDQSSEGEATKQPANNDVTTLKSQSCSENFNSNDMYDLRPSYFQNKDQKAPLDHGNWRDIARQRRNSLSAMANESSYSRVIFDQRPPYQEEGGINGNWRTSQSQFQFSPVRNNLWSSDKEEEESSIDGNWRTVVRKSRKSSTGSFSLDAKSGRLDLSALNNRWPLDIQNMLAREIHNQLASCERGWNIRDTFQLLRALAQACRAGNSENLSKILTAIQGSGFLRYQLPNMLRMQQGKEACLKESEKKQLIVDMITVYQSYLRSLPSAFADLPLDEVQRYFRKMSFPDKSEVEEKLHALKKERDELIQDKRRRNARFIKDGADKKPPNNFRELQIFPTTHELTSDETTFLRANVKKGSYRDTEHYLDVQFRLYREDFIAPLREGIREIVQKVPKNERGQNIKTYDRVQILEKKYTRNGIIYTLHFDVSRFRRTRWESSNRLVYGSFLCLSKDNFANTLFATVANRDPQELAKGLLDVCFIEGQNVYGIEKRDMDQYVMAESPAYFEAYRHVLAALQKMEEGSLPFQKYLVECRREVEAPAYLCDKKEMVCYDLREALDVPQVKEAMGVPLLDTDKWPDVSQLPLNDSQYEALRTALTKEFSVIQGPPGTGKTYVGLKIARCLLTNSHAWNPKNDSPILMVCFTNHALDQFLEGILDFLKDGIIRVGSRCKSERLQKYNLKNDVNVKHEERIDRNRRIEKQLKRVDANKRALKKYELHSGIKKIQDLEGANCILQEHLDSFYYSNRYDRECETLQDVFEAWICNKSNRRRTVDLCQVTPEFKGDYKAPSQQETAVLQCDEETNENISSNDDEDWGVADSDIDVPDPESFVVEDSDQESEDNWEDANSDLESGEEYFECRSDGLHEQERSKGNDRKSKSVISTQEVLVISEKTQPRKTIAIDQEFEILRQLHGEEDLFQPICATLDQSFDDGEASGEEISRGTVQDREEKKKLNAIQDLQIDIPGKETNKKKRRKSRTTTSKATPGNIRRAKAKMIGLTNMKDEEIGTIANIWDLSHDTRLRLYLKWVDMLKEDFKRKIIQEEQAYDGLCREVESVRTAEEEKILRKAKVIGMTTTGAARYHSVLQRIKPKIVIIEEAAEVLEAHIITSLGPDTQQVILIGDHKQLRPKPTVHELAIKYNLEISLFERMVLNKMDCKMLSIQHRMCPEIAHLTKRIYNDEILDDVSVTKFEDVRGMKTNLFFLDHHEEESFHNGLQSYANDHEANMMIALCRYLLQQDYKPSQITILTLYIGQLLTLKDKMPLEEFQGVRVTVVDNFQGEENDIILLSLVRSNKNGSIGFLKESNRICVALSRARKGLYCMGNFGLLSKDRLWKDICEDLKNNGVLGDKIQLACTNHREITEVKKVEDFKKVISGGCGRPCDLRLACGHRCHERCHGSDPEHKDAKKCRKICRSLCPQELHRCLEKCHHPQECGPCLVPATKVFPDCGHKGRTACWINPRTKNCDHMELKTLPCGHKQDVPCFLDASQGLQAQFDQTAKRLQELQKIYRNHSQPTTAKESTQDGLTGDALNEFLTEVAYLKDRSLKMRHNWPAYDNALRCQKTCRSECKRGLHNCSKKCHFGKECGDCEVKIKVDLPGCGHKVLIPCHVDPGTIFCKSKCQRLLKCGHQCQGKCGEDCMSFKCEMLCAKQCENNHACQKNCHFGKPCKKCMIPTEKSFPDCNHKTRVECHVDVTTVHCFMPCEKMRSCGHPCDKWCYEPCNFFPCKARQLKTLPCGHQKVLPCHTNPAEYTCTSLVNKPLPCGHEILMLCNLDPHEHICAEEVTRTLPCGHDSKMKCHSDPSKRCCKELVTKKLPCGHELEMPCYLDPSKRQCSTLVTKTLPCGHEVKMECHANPLTRKCRAQVSRKLSCGHELEMKCHSDPSKQHCIRQALKKLPCGHEMLAQCNGDVTKCICKALVTKVLPCGHGIEIPCNENVSQYSCKELVIKKMRCGHQSYMLCTSDASSAKCIVEVHKALACGHNALVPCYEEDLTKYRCTGKVPTKLKCGHEIQIPCSTKVPKHVICREPVTKKLQCGHENQMPCNVDPSRRTCTTIEDVKLQCGHSISRPCRNLAQQQPPSLCCQKVTRELPCGHEQQMQCHLDPSQYVCTRQVEKKFPCGHEKRLSCKDVSRAVCIEQVVRKLPCGHDHSISCNTSPDDVKCLTLEKKELKCGHFKDVICSTSLDTVICNEDIEKRLPCQHSRKMPCFKEVHGVQCEEVVTRELPCKHVIKMPCHKENNDVKCQEEVLKTLPCKHQRRLPCHLNPETADVQCDLLVIKTLSCGHEIEVPCNKDSNTISCVKLTMKNLPCGHEVEVVCNVDVSTFSCKKYSKKQLPCGHEVQAPCNVDVNEISCDKITTKILPCGHEVQEPCNVDVNEISCDKITTKILPCGHEVQEPCNVDTTKISCGKSIKKTLSCGHVVETLCHKDINKIPCDKMTKKVLPCGHDVEVLCCADIKTISCNKHIKKTLSCGHVVETLCHKDINKISCDKMTKKALPCGHDVEVLCCADIKTISCNKPIKKILSCGHDVEALCHVETKKISCDKFAKRRLPCGHEVEAQCNKDIGTIYCDKLKMKTLPCGHELEILCNVDVKTISCDVPSIKTLPCGHEIKAACCKDIRTITCNKTITRMLSCGHMVEMPCSKDVVTVSCLELTKKKLPCGHEVNIPCNKDTSTISCDILTKKQLSCNHEVEIPCNVDANTISCHTLVTKTLSCTHEAKLPCNLDVSTISCHKLVLKELSCGHKKELPCSVDVTTASCDVLMIKKLPCNHDAELLCQIDLGEYICQRPCEKFLPCNHKCKQKCYETCDPNLCTEMTTKTVPCPTKHKITVPCNVDVQDTFICNQEITKTLDCGHLWQGKCSESELPFRCEIQMSRTLACPGGHKLNLPCYVDSSKIPCDQKCTKLLPCGHPCKLYCEDQCNPDNCKERVLKVFTTCSHTKWLSCGIATKAICLYRCLRPLKGCGHPCQAACGKPCNKPCLYEVRKTLPCGHKMKMKCCDPAEYVRCPSPCTSKLLCGHVCTGNCATCQEKGEHTSCPLPCGRPLVCSHRCHERCSDPCSPCFRECRGWCPHGRCQKSCSEACKPCNMPCAYSCIHDKCSNLCHEMCNREPCNEPCQKMLACGHPCIGLCGESCPILCYVCTPNKVAAVSPNGQRNKDLRFIQLKECGHVIEVNRMHAWMQEPLDTISSGPAQPRRCPTCSAPIYFSFHYGNIVREALRNMFDMESFTLEKRSRRRQSLTWNTVYKTRR